MSFDFNESVFDEFEDILNSYVKKADDPIKILEAGASAFVDDLLKLPKPLSEIRAPGYTHLIDVFSYKESKHHKGEIEVGWGKRYGNILEHGSYKMHNQKHLNPLFMQNKEKYYRLMIEKFNGGI